MSTETKEKKPRKEGVGSTATAALLAGKTNEEALKAVQAKHPEAKASLASINWYRNKLRSEGHDVKTSRELRGTKPKAEKKAKADPLA